MNSIEELLLENLPAQKYEINKEPSGVTEEAVNEPLLNNSEGNAILDLNLASGSQN